MVASVSGAIVAGGAMVAVGTALVVNEQAETIRAANKTNEAMRRRFTGAFCRDHFSCATQRRAGEKKIETFNNVTVARFVQKKHKDYNGVGHRMAYVEHKRRGQ